MPARITSEAKNRLEWDTVRAKFHDNEVDALLIAPERLGNEEFVKTALLPIAGRIGLLVVDEAHCISDWGHDFRPDYRRIGRILKSMPPNTRVLATTATANNRVVADLKSQLGEAIAVQRGPPARESLRLQNISLPDEVSRLAGLADTTAKLSGSGVIYTLTIRDARNVADWLRANGFDAKPYWGAMDEELGHPGLREILETRLHRNEFKALVATTALGMGGNKSWAGWMRGLLNSSRTSGKHREASGGCSSSSRRRGPSPIARMTSSVAGESRRPPAGC